MTEDTNHSEAEPVEERSPGPVGTVVGATLGPVGAALGTVVDDTRFALKLSVGTPGVDGGRSDGAAGEGTTIEIEDRPAAGDDGPAGTAADAADGDQADGDPDGTGDADADASGEADGRDD